MVADARTAAAPRRWPALAAAGMAFAILCALGAWQAGRLAWKENLLATIASRMASPPVAVAEIERKVAENTLPDVDYYPVTVTGAFRYESERHFFATWHGATGFYVYTPLELADGRFVFVNRGFVPYDNKDAGTRLEGQVPGEVTVTGLSRNVLTQKPSFLVPDNDEAKNIFYWKDMRAMTATAGLPAGARVLPFFIDAGDAPNPGGLPVGGVTMVDLPNNHLQYAVIWFGLAAALAGVVAVWLLRKKDASHVDG